ncbi:MAG: ABC transporter permease [Anaerolineae bacterium]
MNKAWIIARNEYAFNIRRTGFILFTILVPLFGLIILLIATFIGGRAGQFITNQIEGDQKPVGIVDQLGVFTPILPEYTSGFSLYPSEAEARAAIDAKNISIAMVIPTDYVQRGVVRVLSAETTLRTMSAVDSGVAHTFLTAHLLRGKIDPILQNRLDNLIQVERVDLTQDIGEKGSTQGTGAVVAGFLVPYLLGILLVMAIFTSSGYLMQSVTEEKSSRVIEVILSSVSPRQMLTGKIIGMGALGLTQVLIWLIAAAALSAVAKPLTGTALTIVAKPEIYGLVIIYFLLGFTIFAVLMGVAGALGTTQQEAQQLSGMLSLVAALPYFLAGFIIQNPNMGIARVVSFFPLTSPTMMLLRIPMGAVPLVDIIGSIVVTGISIPILLWAGAKVFRMGLLVYGKRPGWAVVWKAIKEA